MDDDERLAGSYRRKRVIGTALGLVVVGTSAWALWAYQLRRPSPSAACRVVVGLVDDDAGGEEGRAQTELSYRIGGPRERLADLQYLRGVCEVYFTGLEAGAKVGVDRYGQFARCITTSWSAAAANECFDEVHMFYEDGRRAVDDYEAAHR
ncbi:MAG: hypothetical protein AAF721_37710 [Myxococcota bacterium]